jgi:hypothetical protein
MKTLIPAAIRCSLMLTAVAALSLAYPASLQAVPTTYRYTGNHFTEVSGPYTTSMFVTAMVTLAAPLRANMPPFTDVTPIAFTFFDGVQTLSGSNPDIDLDTFQFGTNAAGQITSWQISVDIGVIGAITNFILNLNLEDPQDPHTHDTGGILENGGQFAEGTTFRMPGVWSRGIATPDTGSTLSLMTLTLMALGLVARRFQRAAA